MWKTSFKSKKKCSGSKVGFYKAHDISKLMPCSSSMHFKRILSIIYLSQTTANTEDRFCTCTINSHTKKTKQKWNKNNNKRQGKKEQCCYKWAISSERSETMCIIILIEEKKSQLLSDSKLQLCGSSIILPNELTCLKKRFLRTYNIIPYHIEEMTVSM